MNRPLPADDLDFVLRRLGPLWDDLRGGRLFLTGGTGFFGLWMLESFLWANDALELGAGVTVLARDYAGFARRAPHLARHPKVTFLVGDVRDFGFPRGEFSHVVHLATDSTLPPTPENADRALDTLVNGSRRVLELARERGAQKFLLASSGAVYGPQPSGMARIPEEYAGGPVLSEAIAPYAEGKRVAEILAASACGFDATIARPFAFVGPHLPLDAHFAVGNFLRDALAGRPLEIRGDGSAVRSYLYAADLAVWLWTILLRGRHGRAYNVGSEQALSVRELAYLVAGPGLPVIVAPVPTARPTSHRYVPDTSRARQELGLAENFPLEDALRRTALHHPSQESLPCLSSPSETRPSAKAARPTSSPRSASTTTARSTRRSA